MSRNWRSPWIEAFRVAMHLLSHLAVVLVLIGIISAVQWALRAAGEPKLLDILPIRYIFDTMDLGLLALFLVFGTISAFHAFREGEDE
jgi:hypothetical protein